MSVPGRTSWLPRDAATHDRELIVELGEEFGAAGPYVLTVLGDLAQQQRAGGTVRTGYRILARKSFTEVETVRLIIERAGEIGALDNLEVDEDGRRFTCRISGWESDQGRAKAAWKKAQQRADKRGQEGDMSPVGPDPSRNVALHDHNQTIETATACEPPSLGAAVEEPTTVVASGKQTQAQPDREHVLLSQLLADLIRQRDPKAKAAPLSKGWLDAIRLLIERDGRSPAEVERVIRWCQADAFWQSNILSAPKLRAKFDQLAAKAGAPGRLPQPGAAEADALVVQWLDKEPEYEAMRRPA